MKPSEIQTVIATITNVDANVGLAVPANMRRYIYQYEITNLAAVANTVTLGKREAGAGVTTAIDTISLTLLNDYLPKPDGPLTEDSVPLFIIECGDGTNSFIRAIGTVVGNNATLLVRYVDGP